MVKVWTMAIPRAPCGITIVGSGLVVARPYWGTQQHCIFFFESIDVKPMRRQHCTKYTFTNAIIVSMALRIALDPRPVAKQTNCMCVQFIVALPYSGPYLWVTAGLSISRIRIKPVCIRGSVAWG